MGPTLADFIGKWGWDVVEHERYREGNDRGRASLADRLRHP